MIAPRPVRGVILAGGSATRLFPLTLVTSKQLLPVYDKPMIYYPLSVLMLAGIRRHLVISTPQDLPRFRALLGDGSQWGLEFEYATQAEPAGIAQAVTIAADHWGEGPIALVLGDNIFFGHGMVELLRAAAARERGATVFAYHVNDPERYGVIEFDAQKRAVSIEEKPRTPRSGYAVTGLYFYDAAAAGMVRKQKPSARGELEITDLNLGYLAREELHVEILGRGYAWLDTGTHEALLEASSFIATVESRQALKVACPEEIAFRLGFIDAATVRRLAAPLANTGYGRYLLRIVEDRIY